MAPRAKLAFLITLCFSPNCTVDSNVLLPPSELARGHTQRAAGCHFPTETRQGLSYFRRFSTGLPLLLLRNPEIQWGPFMLPTNRLGTGLSAHSTELGRTLNVHRRQLAQIQVNYYIKRKTQKTVQNKEIKLGFRTPEPQPQPSL